MKAQGLRACNLGLVVGNGRSVRTHGWMRRQVVVAGVGGSSSMLLLVRGFVVGPRWRSALVLGRVHPQPLKDTLLMKPCPLGGRHRCEGIEPCDLSSQGVGCNNLAGVDRRQSSSGARRLTTILSTIRVCPPKYVKVQNPYF